MAGVGVASYGRGLNAGGWVLAHGLSGGPVFTFILSGPYLDCLDGLLSLADRRLRVPFRVSFGGPGFRTGKIYREVRGFDERAVLVLKWPRIKGLAEAGRLIVGTIGGSDLTDTP